jgi:hypothetical protein
MRERPAVAVRDESRDGTASKKDEIELLQLAGRTNDPVADQERIRRLRAHPERARQRVIVVARDGFEEVPSAVVRVAGDAAVQRAIELLQVPRLQRDRRVGDRRVVAAQNFAVQQAGRRVDVDARMDAPAGNERGIEVDRVRGVLRQRLVEIYVAFVHRPAAPRPGCRNAWPSFGAARDSRWRGRRWSA